MVTYLDLVGNTNAMEWAAKFVETVNERPDLPTDEGAMLTWFANAIMAGYDQGIREQKQRGFNAIVREIAFQAAGVGSAVVMMEAPDVVMPTDGITKGVNKLLQEFGVEGYVTERYGHSVDIEKSVEPNPEPEIEPSDPHTPDLDDDDDAPFLDPDDPRRQAVERKRHGG